jgi:hypothetical protein
LTREEQLKAFKESYKGKNYVEVWKSIAEKNLTDEGNEDKKRR